MSEKSEVYEMITSWANDPYITCEPEKCGMCWKEKIKSEVCKYYIAVFDTADAKSLNSITDLVNEKWHETSLYKRVQDMLQSGMKLEEVRLRLQKEGIEI